jgi:Peptidase family M23
MRRLVVPIVLVPLVISVAPARAAAPWAWPVVGPVIRAFDPPDSPYGTGHRGIDIGVPVGTTVVAPDDGVVSFAGPVGGRLFVTIDHGGGVASTSSWLTSLLVRRNDRVVRGQPVATTGWGHPDLTVPHLHFRARLDGDYVDPIAYLEAPSVSAFIRLAPLDQPAGAVLAAVRMAPLATPTALRAVRLGDRRLGGGANHGIGAVGKRPVAAVPGWPGQGGRRLAGAGPPLSRVVARRHGHR